MQRREKNSITPRLSGAVIAVLALLSFPDSGLSETEWNIGVSGGNRGIEGFHLSIGEYYRVPEREVAVVHRRGIDEEELPVVFFLSQRARVSPDVIVDMRLRHMSWMDITLHFGLSPEIYYVPVAVHNHPPYGKAYGYYHNHPRHTWKKMRFNDHDIVNQVNLRFLSDHYGYEPERIMRSRDEGRTFTAIDRDVRRKKAAQGKAKGENHYYHESTKRSGGHDNKKNTHDEDDWGKQKGPHR